MLSEINVLVLSLLGGIIPALFWLWFWIREDRLKPEPKLALLSSFIGGVIAVMLALFFELVVYYLLVEARSSYLDGFPLFLQHFFQSFADKYNLLAIQNTLWSKMQDFSANFNFFQNWNVDIKKVFLVVIMAPIIEESLKLILTYNICLRRKVNDEPIDASIYMLTAALGFAAVETALFLLDPISTGRIMDSFMAGNFRSIGPMLIHLVSSAVLGIFIGLAFYKSKFKKFLYTVFGLFLAIILHAIFNFFIVLSDSTQDISFFWIACIITWILVIILLVLFEKIKKIIKPFGRFTGKA